MNEKLVNIGIDPVSIEGVLAVPDNARGLVLFSHGSGSSRHSPRNNYVARVLRENGFATLLMDLLTEEEDMLYENRFDIDLLTERLISTTYWVQKQPETKSLKIGYFGASTGAASALKAAAKLGKDIFAVVSRGGRPDLAGAEQLEKVQSPTLLIVGGEDYVVIDLNQKAFDKLKTTKELVIIPGATHLFEEPGALEEVAELAANWFTDNIKQ